MTSNIESVAESAVDSVNTPFSEDTELTFQVHQTDDTLQTFVEHEVQRDSADESSKQEVPTMVECGVQCNMYEEAATDPMIEALQSKRRRLLMEIGELISLRDDFNQSVKQSITQSMRQSTDQPVIMSVIEAARNTLQEEISTATNRLRHSQMVDHPFNQSIGRTFNQSSFSQSFNQPQPLSRPVSPLMNQAMNTTVTHDMSALFRQSLRNPSPMTRSPNSNTQRSPFTRSPNQPPLHPAGGDSVDQKIRQSINTIMGPHSPSKSLVRDFLMTSPSKLDSRKFAMSPSFNQTTNQPTKRSFNDIAPARPNSPTFISNTASSFLIPDSVSDDDDCSLDEHVRVPANSPTPGSPVSFVGAAKWPTRSINQSINQSIIEMNNQAINRSLRQSIFDDSEQQWAVDKTVFEGANLPSSHNPLTQSFDQTLKHAIKQTQKQAALRSSLVDITNYRASPSASPAQSPVRPSTQSVNLSDVSKPRVQQRPMSHQEDFLYQ